MSNSHSAPRGASAAATTVLAGALLSGCVDEPLVPPAPEPARAVEAAAPTPLVTVSVGGAPHAIWPYTGTGFGPTGHESDPINLIFTGHNDPRSIRAALLALDGNRGSPLPFFQCTWDDAMGDNQTAYAAAEGWTGSAIQLECGSYQGLRFHMRLFRAGGLTLANAHFETVIPGTHQHEVLSWELAQQFVVADFMRAGLLAEVPAVTDPINQAPAYRTINPLIYMHPLIAPLHPIINAEAVGSSFGIRSSGDAVVLNLASTVAAEPGTRVQELVINFNQVIPKPFCAGPTDYVHVSGPLHMRQEVSVSGSGVFNRQMHVEGELTVTPVNPLTQQPLGPPGQGVISGLYKGMLNGNSHSTSRLLDQSLLQGGRTQQSKLQLQVGPHGHTRERADEKCG
jgi:hypothetical protein